MTRERLSQLSLESLLHLVEIFDVDIPETEEDRSALEESIFQAIEERRELQEDTYASPIRYHQQRFEGLDEFFGVELAANEWGFEFPEHYNVTRIELMLRDPAWAFTYWDLALQDKTNALKNEDFKTLFLRLEEIGPNGKPTAEIMDVPVQLTDSSWYLNLTKRETSYRVHLVAQYEDKEVVLASSQKITVPRGALSEKLDVLESFETDAIIYLSGIEMLDDRGVEVVIPQRILDIREKWEND